MQLRSDDGASRLILLAYFSVSLQTTGFGKHGAPRCTVSNRSQLLDLLGAGGMGDYTDTRFQAFLSYKGSIPSTRSTSILQKICSTLLKFASPPFPVKYHPLPAFALR